MKYIEYESNIHMGNSWWKFATFLEMNLALDNLTTREQNKRTLYINSRPLKLLIFSHFKYSYRITYVPYYLT